MRRPGGLPSRRPPPSLSEVLAELTEMTSSEEQRYEEIHGWHGGILAMTDKAVCLRVGDEDVWFPKTQLRVISTSRTIFASTWVLKEKGLG